MADQKRLRDERKVSHALDRSQLIRAILVACSLHGKRLSMRYRQNGTFIKRSIAKTQSSDGRSGDSFTQRFAVELRDLFSFGTMS